LRTSFDISRVDGLSGVAVGRTDVSDFSVTGAFPTAMPVGGTESSRFTT
jgi:hypothetical protein